MRGIDLSVDNSDTYEKTYNELGLNLPLFYFSIKPNHYPPSSNSVSNKNDRQLYKRLLQQGYHFKKAQAVIDYLIAAKKSAQATNDIERIIDLENVYNLEVPDLNKEISNVLGSRNNKFFLPKFFWHGADNQFHKWLGTIFNNQFGVSIVDGSTALSKVKKAMTWTLSMTMIDFILSTFLGIWIGVFLVKSPEGKLQKFTSQFLYFLYSIPVFWLATLMVFYFTTDDFGSWTNIFPSVALDIYPGKSTLSQVLLNSKNLILPILILTVHSLAYISGLVRRSLLDELNKPYVLLAYAKGLSKEEVIKSHALKNALTPTITSMASAFAAAFGGSLVIEVVFNIPGMGRLLINSISIGDWNVVFCITLILSFITVVSYIVADVLYAYFNPKVNFAKKQ